MSVSVLEELQHELRRIYVAGSDLAADDYRLKRLGPKLAAAGERSPVLARIAGGVASLIGPAEPEERAAALQDVSLLLHAVLSTQGKTDAVGSADQPVSVRPEVRLPELATDASSRELSELSRILSLSGGGRYETVRSAYEKGLFRDLRSLPLAIRALSDSYAEIADLAAERILPAYGPGIAALLLDGLDAQGGREHERKLQVVRQVGVRATDRISIGTLVRAAEDGAPKIRAAAIACLGSDPVSEERLLAWSSDAAKPIRRSAYAALAALDSEAARARLYEAMTGKDAALAAEAIADSLSPGMAEVLIWRLDELLQGGGRPASGSKSIGEMEPLLTALREIRHPELDRLYADMALDPSSYAALKALDDTGRARVLGAAAHYLRQTGTFEAMELVERLALRQPLLLQQAFPMARNLLTPAEVYERYMGAKGEEGHLSDSLRNVMILVLRRELYRGKPYHERRLPQTEIETQWDPRWLDWAIDRDHVQLVTGLARPGNDRLIPYLEKAIRRVGAMSGGDEIRYVLDMLDADIFDEETRYQLFMRLIEARNWGGNSRPIHGELDRLRKLPAERIGETVRRLEALIDGIEIDYKKKTLQEVVDALRARRGAEQGGQANE